MSDSSRLHGLQSTRLLCPCDFPGKSTGVGCHCLLRNYLLSALCLEASVFRKSRKSQPILKISSKKIIQETSLRCKESLPRALLHTRIAPKEEVGLSTYEMLYGRPFVYVNDLFLDPEAQTLWSSTMATGQLQNDIHLWGVNQDPKDSKDSTSLVWP